MADVDVVKGLLNVYSKMNAVCTNRGLNYKPRLVAVGKTKPKEMIIACYEQGQRVFGENYIQELVDKSTDPEVSEKCKDIKWHFIGSIQRNKVPKLVNVPNLDVVETITSEKVAASVNSSWEKLKKFDPLKVMVQVNTSREEESSLVNLLQNTLITIGYETSALLEKEEEIYQNGEKGGVEVEHCSQLVRYVLKNCPALKFIGLMTIGKYGYDTSEGPNPDFLALKSCRETVCNDLELQEDEVELSMGMSTDFEQAIELGSTSVRVGTTIFGYREKKEPKAVTG